MQIFATDATPIGCAEKPLHFIEVNSQRETIYSMTVTENGDVYVAKMVHIQEQDHNGLINTINKYYIDIYWFLIKFNNNKKVNSYFLYDL